MKKYRIIPVLLAAIMLTGCAGTEKTENSGSTSVQESSETYSSGSADSDWDTDTAEYADTDGSSESNADSDNEGGYWWGVDDSGDSFWSDLDGEYDYNQEYSVWGSTDNEVEYSELSSDSGYDWDSLDEIGDFPALCAYLDGYFENLTEAIPVHFTNGFFPSADDILVATSMPQVSSSIISQDGNDVYCELSFRYYPGSRVAYAYLNNDTSMLSGDELALYNTAVEQVDYARNNCPSALRAELYFHDKITELVTYYTETVMVNMPRYTTALGVFQDGQANCQGYTDAMYMLCKMYGIDVAKQTGNAGNGGHVWNIVNLGDGWSICDVTWDDATFSLNDVNYTTYIYFNCGADVATTHSWTDYTETHQTLSQSGSSFFYNTSEADNNWFGYSFDSIDTLSRYTCQQFIDGDSYIYGMITTDNSNVQAVMQSINDTVSAYVSQSGSATWKTNYQTRGNYGFVYIDSSVRANS